MTDRLTVVIVGILLLLGTIVLIILALHRGYFSMEQLFDYTLGTIQLVGSILIFTYGTIKQTIYWRFISFLTGIFILGLLFKILHWTGADRMIYISSCLIALTYLWWYLRKKEKKHLDHLKLLWVLSFFISAPLFMAHLISADYVEIAKLMFWPVFVDFCILEFGRIKKKTNPL